MLFTYSRLINRYCMLPVACLKPSRFSSLSIVSQHDAAKQRARISSSAKTDTTKPPFHHSSKDVWMWRGTQTFDAIRVLKWNSYPIRNCPAMVSSEAACELICSYSWQDSKHPAIKVPGFAPIWQHIPLPVRLPPDQGTYFIDESAARVPRYPFEPVFRAAAAVNPTINFANVDIVINRNSLMKLLSLCGHKVQDSFRIDLAMVNDTLFVERHEENACEFIGGKYPSSWGHNFEKTFTKLPKGLERSTRYHRVIRYPLGDLNCVVRYEVDACYQEDNSDEEQLVRDDVHGGLALDIGNLSVGRNSGKNQVAPGQHHGVNAEWKVMPQCTVAEIKSTAKNQLGRSVLPQLWFGRTPWLIIGHHVEGTFYKVNIMNTEAYLTSWEAENQKKLKKLVSLLSELRESVKKSGFKRCIATCEKRTRPRELKIFAATREGGVLPDDLISKFWNAAKSE